MEVEIRKARVEDAEVLLEYLRIIGGESDNLSFGPEGLPFTVEQERDFIKSLENSDHSVMLLAWQNGQIVGDGSFSASGRERFRHRGEIGLSVRKDAWGQGIGTKLMEALLDFARNTAKCEVATLEVRSDNARAIHLYEKFGFVKIGTFPAFLKIHGEPISADLMNLYWTE